MIGDRGVSMFQRKPADYTGSSNLLLHLWSVMNMDRMCLLHFDHNFHCIRYFLSI